MIVSKKNISVSIISGFLLLITYIFTIPDAMTAIDNTSPIFINVLPLNKQNADITLKYVGYVTPIKSVDVMANVSGYIDETWANGGSFVSAGDNLVLIDQRQFKAEVDALKAAKSMADAKLINAKNYYNRIMKVEKNAVSDNDRDNAKAQFLSAQAELRQADANLKKAITMLDYTVLQASIDGVVGENNLTKGNFISAGQTKLFSIIQQNPIRIKFAVSYKDYLSLFDNDKPFENISIKIKLADNSIYKHLGNFAYMDNQTDKLTNSVNIFADFENPNNTLLSNSYVDVLLEKKLKNVYLIKQNYTNIEDDGVFVNIINNNKIKKKKLIIVGYSDDAYVVSNDFAKSDFLVIDNISEIKNNSKIKINILSNSAEN